MICVVQRVSSAGVTVGERTVGSIGRGMCVLVAVHATDSDADAAWTAAKLATLRIFQNGEKEFDADLSAEGLSVLLVSNFTVAADTSQGRRPSFIAAAKPDPGRTLFDRLVQLLLDRGIPVETGEFGAMMQVTIVNDGPATVILDSRK